MGANIGAFAVYAAQRTRQRLLAVEPHPENAAVLRRNLRANGAERAVVAECAVADAPGTLPLFLGPQRHDAPAFRGRARTPPRATRSTCAWRRCRSSWPSTGFPRVDFLKLDCEGAEGLILPSLPDARTGQSIRAIALEFHDDVSPLAHDALAKLLAERGYRVSQAWDGRSANGMLFAHR